MNEKKADYRATLNLPKTGFPMKADLVTREPETLARCETMKLYERMREGAQRLSKRHISVDTSTEIRTSVDKIVALLQS